MSLTAIQWQFIAARLLANTDKEAAEKLGLASNTPANWKQLYPEFVREYEASFTDGVHVAKEYTRKALGKAADVLHAALEATDEHGPDYKARLRAVELMFKSHGILREKVDWTPDLSGLTDEELTNLDRLLGRVSNKPG